jgi:hypothetical protein
MMTAWKRNKAAAAPQERLKRCEPVGVDADGRNIYSRADCLAIIEYGMARRLAAEQRLALKRGWWLKRLFS